MTEEARFRRAVEVSWRGVGVLADWYRGRGYDVTVPLPRMRECFEDRAGYGDWWDLEVCRGQARWRFEVKSRTLRFTGAADYPYPTIFVDRVEKALACRRLLAGYLVLNTGYTHVALVAARTWRSWVIKDRFDGAKGYGLSVYACPKDLARYRAL
jgi:hypothetical protein